jgi:hypothetical protein
MATKRFSGSADTIFQKLSRGLPTDLSLIGSKKREAREWFRRTAQEVTSIDANRFMNRSKQDRRRNDIEVRDIGKMYMFWYDAKLKDELPYWDRLPLIFPLEIYKDGFLGINLHYLSPIARARLMDALYSTMNNEKLDDSTHLQIRYQVLKSASRFRGFQPCIKRYLTNHVRSQFINIRPDEWDMALMMPTERFVKSNKQNVWSQSDKAIRKLKR